MAFHSRNKIITDGLIFAYDAYNTKSYVSGDTVANDLVSDGGTSTLVNGITFSGDSWGFDGVSTYMQADQLDSNETTVEVTFEYRNDGSPRSILRQGSNPTTIDIRIDATNNLDIFLRTASCSNSSTFDTTVNLEAGVLYNLVVIFDWPNTTVKVYIDGQLQVSKDFSSECSGYEFDAGNAHPYLDFGRNGASNNSFLEGEIYFVYIYNRILSDSEVAYNYDARKWRFK